MFSVDNASIDSTSQKLTLPKLTTPKIVFFDIDDTLSRGGILAEHNKQTLALLAQVYNFFCLFSGQRVVAD